MKPGDVVLVKFPFSDSSAYKKRPALILSHALLTDKVQTITLAMITSRIEGSRTHGDYLLNEWRSAGLLHPSLLRLSKIATIDTVLVDKSLGQLAETDQAAVGGVFREMFNFWFLP